MHLGGLLGDLVAVARSGRSARGLPAALRSAGATARTSLDAYDRVVRPLLDAAVPDAALREQVGDALRFAALKTGYVVLSYAAMLGRPAQPELAVLGGAFARLYDDLVDHAPDEGVVVRLDELFRTGEMTAAGELEVLLAALHAAIDARLGRSPDAGVYADLRELHHYQRMSVLQRDAGIDPELLRLVTRGKGGLANLVLASLVSESMTEADRRFALDLGEALQLLDDYVDVDLDRSRGIVTPMTRGDTELADVCALLRRLDPPGRTFEAVLYVFLVAAVVKRRRPGRTGRSALWRRLRSPLLVLAIGGDEVFPRAGARPALVRAHDEKAG